MQRTGGLKKLLGAVVQVCPHTSQALPSGTLLGTLGEDSGKLLSHPWEKGWGRVAIKKHSNSSP